MVGHTHEDIDQYFSCIARPLNKYKVPTLSKLIETVKQANKKDKVDAEILENLFDIREWIDEYIPDLHGHLKSYQFKFEAVGEEVTFSYRKRATSTEWTNVDQTKHEIFKDLPTGTPSMVESTFEEMKVPLFVRHLRQSYFKWMSEDSAKEWEDWIVKTKQEIDDKSTKGNCIVKYEG